MRHTQKTIMQITRVIGGDERGDTLGDLNLTGVNPNLPTTICCPLVKSWGICSPSP